MEAPWYVQLAVCVAVLRYLPEYWSFKELSMDAASPGVQRWAGWAWLARRLFGEVRLVVERPAALRACGQGVLAVAPHGVVSFNHALFFTDAAGWFRDAVWPVDRRDLAATALFCVPLYRDLLLALGCVDASRNVARRCLASGRSLFVYPGGEQEQLRGGHVAFWRGRKGFARLAVEFGVPVIPAYAFGEAALYAPVPLLVAARRRLAAAARVALPLAVGRWWCPLLPRRRPLVAVVGAPIPVPRVDPREDARKFDETVDEVHAKVLNALAALFDRHKGAYAEPGATLEII